MMMEWDDDDEEGYTEQKNSGVRNHVLFPGYLLI